MTLVNAASSHGSVAPLLALIQMLIILIFFNTGKVEHVRAHLLPHRTPMQHTIRFKISPLGRALPVSSAWTAVSPTRRGSQHVTQTCAARKPKWGDRLKVGADALD